MSPATDLGAPRRARRMSLTPMIDVVFLLLIFFMLASRFGMDAVLPIQGAATGGGGDWQGPPRLVDIAPDGLALNGGPVAPEVLADAVAALMPDADAPVILRPRDGADLQRLVAVMDLLRAGGVGTLILVE